MATDQKNSVLIDYILVRSFFSIETVMYNRLRRVIYLIKIRAKKNK